MREMAAKSFTSDWRKSERAFVTLRTSSKNVTWKTFCVSNTVFWWTKRSRFPFFETLLSRASIIITYRSRDLRQAITTTWQPLLPGSRSWDHKPLEFVWKCCDSFHYGGNLSTDPVEACPVIQATENVQEDAWKVH